ncbi:MAG: thioredoxin fold domain-containing protein [Spirosomataceae bacterium]
MYSKFILFILLSFSILEGFGQANLVVFLDPECPICQKSSKRLQEMYEKYGQSVAFKAVFPTQSLKKREVRAFNREYDFNIPYRIDRQHLLVEQYNAKVTPEVILFDQNGQEVYRGAIDNQFYELGKNRPKTTEFYLRDALEALKNSIPITKPHTKAVGCLIQRKRQTKS